MICLAHRLYFLYILGEHYAEKNKRVNLPVCDCIEYIDRNFVFFAFERDSPYFPFPAKLDAYAICGGDFRSALFRGLCDSSGF